MTSPTSRGPRSASLPRRLAIACAVALGSGACSGGGSDGAPPPATLEWIAVAPASPAVAAGRSQAFTATGHYGDSSTRDLTALATWTSSRPEVATLAGAIATGLAEGQATITAEYGGGSGTATLTVTPAAIATLTLSPVNAILAAGTTRQYGAVAVYTDGSTADVTREAAWATAPEEVATITAGGSATALAPGAATVSASYGGVSAATPLTVTDASLVYLSVAPSDASVPLGVPQPFTAIGIFSDGTRQDLTAQVAWSSAPQNVATISADGVASPIGPGTATIFAAWYDVVASTVLVVTNATLDALVVDPPLASIAAGTASPFTATGVYSDGSTADLTALATWSSSDASVATISNASGSHGVADGVAPGRAVVTATFDGRSETAELTVTDAYLVAIAVTPSGASAPVGRTEPLTATGTFSDGSAQDLTAGAGWTSSDPAIAAVSNAPGQEGVVTAVVPGTVTIIAAYRGVTGSASFTVTDVTLRSIEVTPEIAKLPAGYAEQYRARATYSDLSERDVTTDVTWQSSDPLVATISNAAGSQGRAVGVAASATPVEITATLPGATGRASLEVTNATLQSMTVTPDPFTIAVGGTVQLAATGTFDDGTVRDFTNDCTWGTSSRALARVSKKGLVTGVSAGSVTITAKKKNRQGAAAGTVD
jgi:trimeric autotransporter adhesin